MEEKFDTKDNIYASGVITYFTFNEKEKHLNFNGKIDEDDSPLERTSFKISKYVRGFNKGETKPMSRDLFPERNKVYQAKVIFETWQHEGQTCMRVAAFEIEKCLGTNFNENPFQEKEDK